MSGKPIPQKKSPVNKEPELQTSYPPIPLLQKENLPGSESWGPQKKRKKQKRKKKTTSSSSGQPLSLSFGRHNNRAAAAAAAEWRPPGHRPLSLSFEVSIAPKMSIITGNRFSEGPRPEAPAALQLNHLLSEGSMESLSELLNFIRGYNNALSLFVNTE